MGKILYVSSAPALSIMGVDMYVCTESLTIHCADWRGFVWPSYYETMYCSPHVIIQLLHLGFRTGMKPCFVRGKSHVHMSGNVLPCLRCLALLCLPFPVFPCLGLFYHTAPCWPCHALSCLTLHSHVLPLPSHVLLCLAMYFSLARIFQWFGGIFHWRSQKPRARPCFV